MKSSVISFASCSILLGEPFRHSCTPKMIKNSYFSIGLILHWWFLRIPTCFDRDSSLRHFLLALIVLLRCPKVLYKVSNIFRQFCDFRTNRCNNFSLWTFTEIIRDLLSCSVMLCMFATALLSLVFFAVMVFIALWRWCSINRGQSCNLQTAAVGQLCHTRNFRVQFRCTVCTCLWLRLKHCTQIPSVGELQCTRIIFVFLTCEWFIRLQVWSYLE